MFSHPVRNGSMWFRLLVILAALTMTTASAQFGEGVGIGMTGSAANPGQTIEVPVTLYSGIHAPTTMVLWFGYDAAQLTPVEDYYEMVTVDGNGDPLTDGDGNVLTTRSGVRADFSLSDTGKTMSVAYHPEAGALAVSIVGLGADQTAIPEGELLTLAFQVDASLSPGPTVTIIGHDTNNPAEVEGQERRSSASDTDGPIPVDMDDGEVQLGCSAPPLPGNVTASEGRADGVLVSWDGAASPGAEYRVYRSETDEVTAALPLGEGWQEETSFLDITAEHGGVVVPGGCQAPAQVEGLVYYYWVASRTPFGCMQAPDGAPAQGYRGDDTKMLSAGMNGLSGPLLLLGLLCALSWVSIWPRLTRTAQ